jgi:hypothetical protein
MHIFPKHILCYFAYLIELINLFHVEMYCYKVIDTASVTLSRQITYFMSLSIYNIKFGIKVTDLHKIRVLFRVQFVILERQSRHFDLSFMQSISFICLIRTEIKCAPRRFIFDLSMKFKHNPFCSFGGEIFCQTD